MAHRGVRIVHAYRAVVSHSRYAIGACSRLACSLLCDYLKKCVVPVVLLGGYPHTDIRPCLPKVRQTYGQITSAKKPTLNLDLCECFAGERMLFLLGLAANALYAVTDMGEEGAVSGLLELRRDCVVHALQHEWHTCFKQRGNWSKHVHATGHLQIACASLNHAC